jgi:hypothetical protein
MKHRTTIALCIALAVSVIAAGVCGYQWHKWQAIAVQQHDLAQKNADGWNKAVDTYNAFIKPLNDSCKGVVNDDGEPAEVEMGCLFGAMADARDKGATEGETWKQVQDTIGADADPRMRDFARTMNHRLFTDYAHMNRYEVSGAARVITAAWMQANNITINMTNTK